MTLAELLCLLRQRLLDLDTKDQDDRRSADQLFTTFSVLADIIEASDNKQLAMILSDLAFSARDYAMDVKWKADIPSVQKIKSALSKSD